MKRDSLTRKDCEYCDSEPCSCLFCHWCGWRGESHEGRWYEPRDTDFVRINGDRVCRVFCAPDEF